MRGTGIGLVVLLLAVGFAWPVGAQSDDAAVVLDDMSVQTQPARVYAPTSRRDFEVERAWFGAGAALERRATQTRRKALELGTNNLEPAARALIAAGDPKKQIENARLAVSLAPDLPMARMALASAFWSEGEYRSAIAQVLAGLMALPFHLEASLWMAGSLLLILASVLIGGSVAFIFAVGALGFSRAAHDLGDLVSTKMPGFARAALLFAVIGLPLALSEGLLGLLLCLLAIGVIYGGPRHRMVLALSVVMLLIGLYPVLQLGGMAVDALDSDPVATASLATVRGHETPAHVALLQEAELQGDDLAARVLAVRTMRRGETERAQERFLRLVEDDAADALVLTALGNMAFRSGDLPKAIEYYEKAKSEKESAVLLFDLSQAYARTFRMEEFELAMERAQSMDHEIIAELSALGDPEFVADVPFPIAPIRSRMFSAADGEAFVHAVVRVIAPGRLGESPIHVAASFVLVFLTSVLLMTRYQHAGRCSRCGRRICARCDDSMWSADLCDGCHHLFNRPQGTDPQLRMARLKALRAREDRIDKLATAMSVVVPGASGLAARRPDLAFISILFFGGAIAFFGWRHGVVPDPLAVGGAGPLAFVIVGSLMALMYTGVMLFGIMVRRSS